MEKIKGMRRELLLFFILIGVVAFANGLSDTVLSNYFKDAYDINAEQRAFIEFPREMPGMLCVFIIGALSFLGDIRLAVLAQIAACIGITILGFITPSFSVMLIFLFIYSLGMHLFMPLSDSIGMKLAEPGRVGERVGQYGSLKTGIGFLTGILVFIGFRVGFFSFKVETKWIFVISAIGFFIAICVACMLVHVTKGSNEFFQGAKVRFVFRKKYINYYILTILNGVQKQIAYVFGSWVIIDLLLKGADVMSILTIIGSFCGIFFFRCVGRWLDTKGVKFMLYMDALSFIFVYIIYGVLVWAIVDQWFPNSTWIVYGVYLLFILDRLSMQLSIVKAVYLRSIAISPEDVTSALSTGISLDHMVAIVAAQISGFIWMQYGAQWVFFLAAFLSLGNLIIAYRIPKEL